MARTGPETRLDHRIVKAVLAEYPDAWIFKVHGSEFQMSGVPDLLVCVHGLLVGMEVKCQGPGESEAHARERTTVPQRIQIARINRAGGIAATVLTPAEALALIERGRPHQGQGAAKALRRRVQYVLDRERIRGNSFIEIDVVQEALND